MLRIGQHMNPTALKSFLFILIMPLGMLMAQVPDGGIMLNRETGTTWQKIGKCTVTEVTVSGPDFDQALRVQTGADLSNSWDAQVKFPASLGVEEEDVVLVAFYARTIASQVETGEGFLTVCLEQNTEPYEKQLYYNVSIGTEWKEYYARVQVNTTLPALQVSYMFHMGFPSQTVEVARVRFLNYRNTLSLEELPETEITYIGQDPDAAWRITAAERIGQIRKGEMQITVVDESGQPLEGAEVHMEMEQHKFGFGTAISAEVFNSNEVYRNTALGMFNEVVFENDLKWPQVMHDYTHDRIFRALDTLDAHNIPVRGHNIVWPRWGNMPGFVEDLANDPEAMRNAIDSHIDKVTALTKGRLNDWDVLNEPYTCHDVQDILGDEVMADWFKRTRRTDRGVKLYINDYSIINGGGKNQAHQDHYYNTIRYIDSLGGGIEGIGIQGHFGSELTSIERVYEILDRFAVTGKEIKVTEHDIDLVQREVQADYTRDLMTILFSHPSVSSLLMWGFWEGRHWKPDGAFFDNDWTIRPHGEVWNRMTKEEWWTPPLDAISGSQGEISFGGFLGTYSFTVTSGDQVRTGTFTLDHSFQSGLSNSITISLDGSVPESVEITPDRAGFICQGETVTLQAPEGEGLAYTWNLDGVPLADTAASLVADSAGSYRVTVSKNGISMTSEPYLLEVRGVPEAAVNVDGALAFCEGGSVTFSTSPEPGLEYDWYFNNSREQWGGASFETSRSGIVKLKVTSEGCSAVSERYDVSVDPNPPVSIEAVGELTICQGEELYLRTTFEPGIIYYWSNGEEFLEKHDFFIRVTESGSYSVSVETGNCISTSDTLVVTVNPLPEAAISVTGDLTFCPGGTVTLTANEGEGLTYTWMKDAEVLGFSGRTIEVGEAGDYSLTTTSLGCSASSEPVTVTVLDPSDPQCSVGITAAGSAFRIYPNPFKGSFQVDLPYTREMETRFEIYDIDGRLIKKRLATPGSNWLDLPDAAPGVYWLRIIQGDVMQNHKIISR